MSSRACIVITAISYWLESAGSRCRCLGQVLGLAGASSGQILVSAACGPSAWLSCWKFVIAGGLHSSGAWLCLEKVIGVSAASRCLGLLI